MEIGVFGSPGALGFTTGIAFGIFGLFFLVVGSQITIFNTDNNDKIKGGVLCIVGLVFFVVSMTLLPIGHGRQRIGDCFDRLPAAILAVDGAFKLNEEVLYVVVRGKNHNGNIVRECATLQMGSVKDYPGRPVEPGEYWIVVRDDESAGAKWTTNTFVLVEPGPKR